MNPENKRDLMAFMGSDGQDGLEFLVFEAIYPTTARLGINIHKFDPNKLFFIELKLFKVRCSEHKNTAEDEEKPIMSSMITAKGLLKSAFDFIFPNNVVLQPGRYRWNISCVSLCALILRSTENRIEASGFFLKKDRSNKTPVDLYNGEPFFSLIMEARSLQQKSFNAKLRRSLDLKHSQTDNCDTYVFEEYVMERIKDFDEEFEEIIMNLKKMCKVLLNRKLFIELGFLLLSH
ncbi:hypothetical protein MHBO_003811 [Bonamia ostreae]|uniref:Uncharacterized protein n=1 Tax=Bonamia ostreae TaxID=126728 RepID=A0ABV2ARK8_9EUKA